MKIYMDLPRMEEALARMKARQNDLVQLIADFRAIQGEIDAAWDGAARDAFDAEYSVWLSRLELLAKQNGEFQQDIRYALQDLKSAESSSGKLFGDVTTDAPPPENRSKPKGK